jgi:hypothetical protein
MRRCADNKSKPHRLNTCAMCLCFGLHQKVNTKVMCSASHLLPRNLLTGTSMVPSLSIYTSSFIT